MIREEINKTETKNRKDKQELVFFKDKINKPSARLIKEKRERTQTTNPKNKREEITTDTAERPC